MKTQDENVTIYRLSESNFDFNINVLNIDMNFIVVCKDRLVELFMEKHKIRCYKLSEMKKHLESNGFKPIAAYDWDAKDTVNLKAPRKETLRILMVSERKPKK